ncbi:MAG: hypothetical protein HZA88_00805 [Verrucomicrobia bacterium]|nr:hypothetical protein [Verrucomicrobiota bacterium]
MNVFTTLVPRSLFVSLLFAAVSFGAQAAQPKGSSLVRGLVHMNIPCRSGKEFHCNIFVPKGCRADVPTPVLYVFAPGGDAPVDLYRAAADRLGWLVCGSVESRNGQEMDYYEKVLAAMQGEMNAQFTLHPHRVYYSGMSGGSRVALELFCNHRDSAAGVIAMAAGPARAGLTKVPGGACVGIAGRHDFNYAELAMLAEKSAAADIAYLFMDFEGQHGWAPKGLVAQAMEWLEVQYFIRSPHLTVAEETKRAGIIADQIRRISLMGATMAAYEACECLQCDLSEDPAPLNNVERMMAYMKPMLARELGAREALRQAFAAVRGHRTSYQMEQALQTQIRELAQKHPNTVYGARAGILVETIGKNLKMFPPEMKQQEQRSGKSRTKG